MGILNVDNLRGVGSGTSVTCLSNRLETTNINASGIVTATTFTGNLAGTVNTAAQGNITSLGTLTGLAIDDNTDTSMSSSSAGQLKVGGNGYTGAIALDADAMHIYHNSSIRDMVFGINESEKVRITSTGQLQATSAADVRLTLGSSGTAGTNDSVHIRADSADLKFMAASGGTTIFETNGTETFRIDGSTGNKIVKNGRLNISSTFIDFSGSLASTPATAAAIFRPADNTLAVSTANVERVRIDSGGTFVLGNHTNNALAVATDNKRGLNLTQSGRIYCKVVDHWDLNRASTGEIIRFRKGNDSGSTQTHVGDIEITSSGVDYNQSASDSRLKKNIETWADEVLPHFKTLQPKKFNFNWESDTDTKSKGYMAQDVTSAFPEAFHLSKMDIGETDSNGDPVDSDRYMFAPGKMVPYLMKALQEEIVKREALEARIAVLESA